jgi:hypothetical protein
VKNVKSISDWLIIFIFCGVLLSSFLLWLFLPGKRFSENEKRPLARFPELTTAVNAKDYLKQFDLYYQDHFGLREWMTHRYQREVRKRFGESGSPLVIEGKAGWLFTASENVLEDLQGKLRFDEDELNRLCQGLQEKHDWFARQGILYIPFVAPNKQSIYGHKMKDSYRILKGDTTRFDQVLGACNNGLLYDLRSALRKKSESVRSYAKTDTHWNYQGALCAYDYLMAEIQKKYPDFMVRKQFTFAEKPKVRKGGDLAMMLGQSDSMTELWPVLQKNELWTKRIIIPPEIKQHITHPKLQPMLYQGNPKAIRLLVLRDSFFNALIGFMSVNFSESLYVWQFFDRETLKTSGPANLLPLLGVFKPDVVIEEIVERHLDWLLESVDHDWRGPQQESPDN